jgi:hypothetical protein
VASPKDFEVGSPPLPASYQAPQIGLQIGDRLGQLPQQYRAAQLQSAFSGGLPTGPNGQIDINATIQTLVKLGGAEYAQQMLPTLLKQQFMNQPDPLATTAPGNDNQPGVPRSAPEPAPRPTARQQIEGGYPPPARTADAGGTFVSRFAPVYGAQTGMAGPEAPATDPNGSLAAPEPPAPRYGTEFSPGRGDRFAQSQQPGTGTPGSELVPSTWAPNARKLGYDNTPTGYANYLLNRAKQIALYDPAAAKPFEEAAGKVFDAINKGTEQIRGSQLPTEQARNLASGATQRGEELKFEVERGNKVYGTLQARDSTYQQDLKPSLDVTRAILNDPRSYTGIGAQRALDINRVRAAFGDQKAAMLQEALKKVTATSVLAQVNNQRFELQEAGGQSSKIFKEQVQQVNEASPRMETSLGGNRFLVEYQTRVGELGSQIAERARDYVAAHGHLDVGFDRQTAAYLKSHPLFSKAEISDPILIGAPSIPPELAKNHAGIIVWGQQMGLQRGDVMRDSKGEYRTMP